MEETIGKVTATPREKDQIVANEPFNARRDRHYSERWDIPFTKKMFVQHVILK